ncbi:endonuclease/exonuclease/phosphatase family protein [Hydrogenophaga aromaticivorans]|uniref:endonuclease/exonuclease/phosphatase family protein n=1 Tax=Hydrogenophaga aromaticivorans TaxID=2610898 RepID=UPI001B3819D2|nr:endonuclease/exonuclease/phosphatase family protein [Hydrogenophaga aromaticivorans]MBQ0917747.1 endonuclease/exonuclease/phosphatase family protein [Hydrogenophaga aromaticivorans]
MTDSGLRISSWNCGGGLRKKWRALDELNADLLVIQECENPALAADPAYLEWAGNFLWTGPSKSKGIGVFARNGLQLEQQPLDLGALEFFLPCTIDGDWPLLATWTGGASSGMFSYIGQLWRYLQLHKNFVNHPRGMVIGDLNSNTQWDKQHRTCCHSDVVKILSELGLQSAYHRYFAEAQGQETRATFFHRRKVDKPYHIDYAFLGADWLEQQVLIGTVEKWLLLSDHVPISVVARRVESMAS